MPTPMQPKVPIAPDPRIDSIWKRYFSAIAAQTSAEGPVGPQGPQGETGAAGGAGSQGATGPQGNPGAAGEQGIQGLTGDTGAAGQQGAPGNDGAAGAQGIQGLQGNAGSQGIQGIPGPSVGTAAFGYGTGAGGTVTQLTNKATGVTLNKLSGTITTHNAALAAAAEVKFTVTNNQVVATDVPLVAIKSGGTSGAYDCTVGAVAAGSFDIVLANKSAGSLSQAVAVNFAVIKSVAA